MQDGNDRTEGAETPLDIHSGDKGDKGSASQLF